MNESLTKSQNPLPQSKVGDVDIVDVGIGIVLREVPNTDRSEGASNTPTYDILITRRPDHTVYGGYWELPGGKAEPGEPIDACVRRELSEEVGVSVEVIRTLPDVIHTYQHATVRLHPRLCRLAPGSPEPRNLHVAEHRWSPLSEIKNHKFPEANAQIIEALERALSPVRR